ncbi:hypothetical protein MMC11_003941 [Xylographa trunciseda]|nr:hypothetical protein [Xylographa trunciseda]
MTLEDFEKGLADARRDAEATKPSRHHTSSDSHRRHHHSHHRSHHRSEEEADNHRPKRRRRSRSQERDQHESEHRSHRHRHGRDSTKNREPAEDEDTWVEKDASEPTATTARKSPAPPPPELKRDSWMEPPPASAIETVYRRPADTAETSTFVSAKADFEQKIRENELSQHHLQRTTAGEEAETAAETLNEPAQHEVDYTFGDAGAQWRMLKLQAVYRHAAESGAALEAAALDRYGDLRAFDDAREEELELERRGTYGEGYVGKEKPSGELFQERKMRAGVRRGSAVHDVEEEVLPARIQEVETVEPVARTAPLDQTALNKLKAQMMKAKLRGASNATILETEYNTAMAAFASGKMPEVVVLGTMENRMLAGGRHGEVKEINNRRGRERGLVEENEDMSIEDMVREERRTRGQAGGEGQRFAERIAKDGKFDNDLDYMDENANKLAKRVQKSEINLRNTAIADFQKMNRILDNCPLCYHEDTDTPPIAPVVSLATRVYLTLPTEPEISEGGACIIPIQHRTNLLECDDDEWEEIRNFMKSLTRMYHDQGRSVIFYENAAVPQRKKHAGMEVVPLPYSLGETAPAFFKEAILSADEEWTQHKKLIDTLAKARQGNGKMAFRRTLAKEMPYFHVWFEIDGGLGHIVEDIGRWPKGDLFAREILGGMLDVGPEVVKRQGKWDRGDMRVEGFRKRWKKFDWTRILTS